MNVNRIAIVIMVVACMVVAIGPVSASEEQEMTDGANASKVETTAQGYTPHEDSVFALIDNSFLIVEPILRKSCYGCHSRYTRYPWYYELPGIKQLIEADIKDAREYLDFSDGFPFGGSLKLLKQLDKMKEEVTEGDMPPWSYQMIHWGTAIESTAQDSLFQWIDTTSAILIQLHQEADLPH